MHVLHSFLIALDLSSGDSVSAMGDDLDIDLTNPKLGKELLKDARGDLPINVWKAYFWQHGLEHKSVLAWCVDPDDPDIAPIDPQQAVDQAVPLVTEVIRQLLSDSRKEALEAARRAIAILLHGSSAYQRGRGLPRTMQHQAVRAWIIRRYNPHPTERGKSAIEWAPLADLLFLENRKCPRSIHDDDGQPMICGKSRHQYDDRCVKNLRTAVQNLESAMEHDGVPV